MNSHFSGLLDVVPHSVLLNEYDTLSTRAKVFVVGQMLCLFLYYIYDKSVVHVHNQSCKKK